MSSWSPIEAKAAALSDLYLIAAAASSSDLRAAATLTASIVTDLPSLSNAPAESSIDTTVPA